MRANVQRTALLVAAFALGRGDLLHVAMQIGMHAAVPHGGLSTAGRLLPLAGNPACWVWR